MKDPDTNEQKDLVFLREKYKELSIEYREKLDALKGIEQHIMATVDRQRILCLDGSDTVHQKLVALKERLAPTDGGRELDVIRRYRELLQPPPKRQIGRRL